MTSDAMARLAEETEAPLDRGTVDLDVRALGPPKPLTETLTRLSDLDDAVLIQHNDRAPQHLYPKLEDRGFDYATVTNDAVTVTAIWRP